MTVGRLIDSMSEIVPALREEVLDFLIALALNFIFAALVALVLWPLGKTALALKLAQGYGVLWVVTLLTAVLLHFIQHLLRVRVDTHFDAYLISNLSHSIFLLAGWSAFAALTVGGFVAGAPVWVAALLWLIGLLSSYVAFVALSAFYQAIVYKMVNAPLAMLSFIVFAWWPVIGRAIYGWFFNLF